MSTFTHPLQHISGKNTTDGFEDHEDTVSIGNRTITNLRFADDIDGLAGEEELAKLVEHLDKAPTASGMEISAEKTKLMANNTSGINTEIKVDAQKLETVTSLKYLGSVITDEASNVKLLSRIAQATAAQTKLKPVWNDRSISPSFKIRLMRSLVTSIFLCACEAWTLTGELQRKNTNHGNEVLRQNTTHLIQRPCYQRGSPCQDPAGNRTTRRPPDDRKETQTASGMVMSPVHQVWPKPPCKAQWKGEEDKADKERGGKTTSRNGQAWSSASPRGQWRTWKNGGNWLRNHLWCPNDLRG